MMKLLIILRKKKVCVAEFDLTNVDILIENNLLENELINPLYLS